MEKALQTLVAPGSRNTEDDRKSQTTDVLNYVQLLFENVVEDIPAVFNTVLHSKNCQINFITKNVYMIYFRVRR